VQPPGHRRRLLGALEQHRRPEQQRAGEQVGLVAADHRVQDLARGLDVAREEPLERDEQLHPRQIAGRAGGAARLGERRAGGVGRDALEHREQGVRVRPRRVVGDQLARRACQIAGVGRGGRVVRVEEAPVAPEQLDRGGADPAHLAELVGIRLDRRQARAQLGGERVGERARRAVDRGRGRPRDAAAIVGERVDLHLLVGARERQLDRGRVGGAADVEPALLAVAQAPAHHPLDDRREPGVLGRARVPRRERHRGVVRPALRPRDRRVRGRQRRARAARPDRRIELELAPAVAEVEAHPALHLHRRHGDAVRGDVALDRGDRVAAVGVAVLRAGRRHALDDRGEPGGGDPPRRRGIWIVGVVAERRAGEHLAQRDAGRVLVGAAIDRLAALLLGRHVAAGAGGRAVGRRGLEPARDPEVDQLGHAGERDHHVAGLDVAVHEPDDVIAAGDRVRVGEAPQHVGDDRERDVDGQPVGRAIDEIVQRHADDQLEHDHRARGRVDHVEHADDVRVVQPRRDVRLVDERAQLAPRVLVGRALDDDQAIEVHLAGEQHLAHAAGREWPHDVIAITYQLTRSIAVHAVNRNWPSTHPQH